MSSSKDLYNRLNKKVISIAALSVIGVIIVVLIIPAMSINSGSIANSITNTGSINPTSIAKADEEKKNNIVPLDQIVSGGPPPDGIPSIDKPKFISIQDANKYLEDSELVLGLSINVM